MHKATLTVSSDQSKIDYQGNFDNCSFFVKGCWPKEGAIGRTKVLRPGHLHKLLSNFAPLEMFCVHKLAVGTIGAVLSTLARHKKDWVLSFDLLHSA